MRAAIPVIQSAREDLLLAECMAERDKEYSALAALGQAIEKLQKLQEVMGVELARRHTA